MSILQLHGVGGRPRSWDRVLPHLTPALRSETLAVDITVVTGQSMAEVAQDVGEVDFDSGKPALRVPTPACSTMSAVLVAKKLFAAQSIRADSITATLVA